VAATARVAAGDGVAGFGAMRHLLGIAEKRQKYEAQIITNRRELQGQYMVMRQTGYIPNALISEPEFTIQYMNTFFKGVGEDPIPYRYYELLKRMLKIFEEMQADEVVWFERCTAEELAIGHANNVWGFHRMRVLNRERFDALVEKAASPAVLGSHNMVYEVMVEIGGMTVLKRAPQHCGPAPKDKKKLGQEGWFFNLGWFKERKRKREPRWGGKRNMTPGHRVHKELVQCENPD
jgi:hypothetical protein